MNTPQSPDVPSQYQTYKQALAEEYPEPLFKINDVAAIPASGFALMTGRPGAGKSAIALHWCCEMAMQGIKVVYMVLEGAAAFKHFRLKASLKHYDLDTLDANMGFINAPVELFTPGGVARAKAWAREGFEPQLVVVDTLSRALGSEANENDNAQMITVTNNALAIANAALILHHPAKNGGHYRGASSLDGGAEAVFYVSKQGNMSKLVTKKLRDGMADELKADYILEAGPIARPAALQPNQKQLIANDNRNAVLNAIKGGASTRAAIKDITSLNVKTVIKHIDTLLDENIIVAEGMKSNRKYRMLETYDISV